MRRAYLALTIATSAAAAVSCSSSNAAPQAELDAGDDDGGTVSPSPVVEDAGIDVIHRDPPPFDGGPRPVECATTRCAKALVTTFGASASDFGEGYCVLASDGTVACWGANGAGQLGRGAGVIDDGPTAARVPGVANIRQLDHTCALDGDGAVWCWGTGPHLAGGTGAITTDRAAVKLPLESATAIGIGPIVGCAVVDGSVSCWGRNMYGQLAPLTQASKDDVFAPKLVELPPGAPVRSVVVSDAVFALREDGTVVTWGANPPLARVSSLFPDPYPTPAALAGVSSLSSSYESACVTVSGVGYWWGAVPERFDEYWLDEDAPRIDRALPEAVSAPEPLVRIDTTRALVTRGLSTLEVVPQRWCAVGASGDVYCWGYNQSGQAGDGTKANVLKDPVKVRGLPAPAVDVKTLPTSTCALLATGKVYCWGANYYGQLGSGQYKVPSLVPLEVVLP